jgi:hypothetical protein
MVKTKCTTSKSTGGKPIGGLKKVPQEEIRQVRFMDEVLVKIKDKNAFKRRDTIMIKSHELFYPPTLMHKVWYELFQITRICKNNRVEIKDHTRWLDKVPIEEFMHVRDICKTKVVGEKDQLLKSL